METTAPPHPTTHPHVCLAHTQPSKSSQTRTPSRCHASHANVKGARREKASCPQKPQMPTKTSSQFRVASSKSDMPIHTRLWPQHPKSSGLCGKHLRLLPAIPAVQHSHCRDHTSLSLSYSFCLYVLHEAGLPPTSHQHHTRSKGPQQGQPSPSHMFTQGRTQMILVVIVQRAVALRCRIWSRP